MTEQDERAAASDTGTPTRLARVGADDWQVLLPPGWASLSTEPEQARTQIKRIIDRKVRGKPRDEMISMRVEVDQRLRAMVEQARVQGATRVHLCTEPVAGLPVAASLVVTPLTMTAGDEIGEVIRAAMGDATGTVSLDRVEIAGHPAVRRHRRTRGRVGEEADAPEMWRTNLDHLVDLGQGDQLLLAWSTTTDQVADALVFLFDALAETLRPAPH